MDFDGVPGPVPGADGAGHRGAPRPPGARQVSGGRGGTDVVIVGGGASGLSLAHRLARAGDVTVTVVEAPDGPLRPAERTWCYWEEGPGEFDGAVVASWSRLRVHGRDGVAVTADPAPLRYRMLRSASFESLVLSGLARRPGARVVRATAHDVRDGVRGGAEVHCTAPDGRALVLRARYAFDSRPPRRLPPARTTLLQHFRGWFVRTAAPRFDPGVADLMDFRVPQPRHGPAFGYLLPWHPTGRSWSTRSSPAPRSPPPRTRRRCATTPVRCSGSARCPWSRPSRGSSP